MGKISLEKTINKIKAIDKSIADEADDGDYITGNTILGTGFGIVGVFVGGASGFVLGGMEVGLVGALLGSLSIGSLAYFTPSICKHIVYYILNGEKKS